MANYRHSFLAKCQAHFLRTKKESLKANEVIVLGDFLNGVKNIAHYTYFLYILIAKTLLICVIISKISIWMLNGLSLQLVMSSHHAMVLGNLLRYVCET